MRTVKATRGKQPKDSKAYEVSSIGDKRFSAFSAKLPDGRSIEEVYQCDIKYYDIGGSDWAKGKGKPSRFPWSEQQLYDMYVSLWKYWCLFNLTKVRELISILPEHDYTLNDVFATSECNQATALAEVLNTVFLNNPKINI